MSARPLKRMLASPAVRAALCVLGARYIRLVHATSRWQVVDGETPAAYWDRGEPFILAFWHGRLLMMPCAWRRGVPMTMLISHHRDGQFIADIIGRFGLGGVRGSSSHGGGGAIRALIKSLKKGTCAGFTPDGPRGPRMRAKGGVVALAKLSGTPVIPCGVATSRRRLLATWDRFMIALPFSRGALVWGTPITVPRDADEARMEAARLAVEEAINAVTETADRLVGSSPVAPATAEASSNS